MQWANKRRELLARDLAAIGPAQLRVPGHTAFAVKGVLITESHWFAGGAMTLHDGGVRFQADARLGGADRGICWSGVMGGECEWDVLALDVRTLRGQPARLILHVRFGELDLLAAAAETLGNVLGERFVVGAQPLERVTPWPHST